MNRMMSVKYAMLTCLFLIALPLMANAQPGDPSLWTLRAGFTGGSVDMLPHYNADAIFHLPYGENRSAYIGLSGLYATSSMTTEFGVEDAPNYDSPQFRLKGGAGLILGLTALRYGQLSLHLESNLCYVIHEKTQWSGDFGSTLPGDQTVSTGTLSGLLVEYVATVEFVPVRRFGIAVGSGVQVLSDDDSENVFIVRISLKYHL
jgi:hypothetical protein